MTTRDGRVLEPLDDLGPEDAVRRLRNGRGRSIPLLVGQIGILRTEIGYTSLRQRPYEARRTG